MNTRRLTRALRASLILSTALPALAAAQTAAQAPGTSEKTQTESITVRAAKRLLREKNAPSAVTELGQKNIAATGPQGSTATLLRQAPSVFVYQQGIGYNEPVLSIRGVRGLEVAATLDGVPMQDLLNGGTGSYLVGNVGSRFALPQIEGVHVYPGVAYPDKNTFGTIGGTIAYDSKRPENERFIDVYGTAGSFKTFGYGVDINSGRIDSPLGTGDNAAKLRLSFDYLNTAGFIDYTSAHYNNFAAAFDKPYDDGRSKFQATVLYNTGSGYLQSEPTPVPLLDKYGRYANYPTTDITQYQKNNYLTVILKNDTEVNDYLQAGITAFYLNSDSSFLTYENPDLLNRLNGLPFPFVQVPYNFYSANWFQPIGPNNPLFDPVAGYDPNNPFYTSTFRPPGSRFTYDPSKFFGTPACKSNVPDPTICGLNAQLTTQHNDSYGIQPRFTVFLPEFAGIQNTIKLGGMVAKETQPTPQNWIWGSVNVPQNVGNQFQVNGYDGGSQRTLYLAYISDKIDLLDNTLHITPGATLEGTSSSNKAYNAFRLNPLAQQYFAGGNPPPPPAPGADPNVYDPRYLVELGGYNYKLKKWDREFLPFLNVSYDFDRLVPALAGLSVYGSTGTSALFAPATDFVPSLTGGAPYASIVHMYEGGVQYAAPKLFGRIDYFYQKVDRDFGFYSGQGNQTGYTVFSNLGQREFKGFEAQGQWQVTPHWQVFGTTSFVLAKYLKTALAFTTVFEDQYGAGIKGFPISGIPDWLANFGVEYDNTNLLVDDDNLSVRFAGQYTGQQYITCDNYGPTDAEGNPDPRDGRCEDGKKPIIPQSLKDATGGNYGGLTITDLNHKIPEFAVFNLLVSYTMPTPRLPVIKRMKFDLNVQNLFDHRYWQSYYSQITPVAGTYTGPSFYDGLPGQPFSVSFTVTARF